MEHSVILHNMQPEQLAALFANTAEATFKKLFAESQFTAPGTNDVKLLTRKEACKRLRISLPTLYTRMKDGSIPFVRLGRRVLFEESAIRTAINPDFDSEVN